MILLTGENMEEGWRRSRKREPLQPSDLSHMILRCYCPFSTCQS